MKQRNKNTKPQTFGKPEPTAAQREPQALALEQIQKRAYEIYESRGGAPGREWADWLLAEIQLQSELEPRKESAE